MNGDETFALHFLYRANECFPFFLLFFDCFFASIKYQVGIAYERVIKVEPFDNLGENCVFNSPLFSIPFVGWHITNHKGCIAESVFFLHSCH